MIKFDPVFYRRGLMFERLVNQARVGKYQKLRHIRFVKDGISLQVYVGGPNPWQSQHLSNTRIAEILDELAS